MDLDLVALKILVLLHDPPFKPILSAAKSAEDNTKLIRAAINEDRCREIYGDMWDKYKQILDEHEQLSLYIISELIHGLRESRDEAKRELAEKLLGYASKYKDVVYKFDAAASSIDRSILSMLYGDEYINQVVFKHPIDLSEEDLTNMVRDKLLYTSEGILRTSEFKDAVNEYVKLILRMVSKARVGLEYILLWRSIIPIFVHSIEKAYGGGGASWIVRLPADTRAPISTLIDHLYATASLSTAGMDEYIGLIYWEVSGKQSFISEARIPRDLWAGSYLISLLTLYACIKLSDELGPDSIFKPLLFRIPLYDKYIKYVNEGKGILKIDEEVLIPLIPGSVLVIVPGSRVKEYVDKILEWYREGWGKIVKVVVQEVFTETILKKFRETIDKLETMGIGDIGSRLYIKEEPLNKEMGEPPFNVSISYIKVPWRTDERRSLLSRLMDEKILDREDIRNLNMLYEVAEKLEYRGSKGFRYEFYEWPYLVKAVTHLQRVSSRTKICANTLDIIDVKDRREWCNVCWRREAIIRIPRREAIEKEEAIELINGILGELYRRGIIIKDGEALCLHCLVRRVLFNTNIITGIIKKLLFADYRLIKVKAQEDLEGRSYPSTEDIAISPLMYSLASILSKRLFKTLNENDIKKIYNILYNLSIVYSIAVEATPFDPGVGFESLIRTRSANSVFNELKRKLKDLNGDIIKTILTSFPLILYSEHYIRSKKIIESSGFKVKDCLDLIDDLNKLIGREYEKLKNCIKQFNIFELAEIIKRVDDEITGSASLWLTDYLLLVNADGDNLGDMLSASGKYRKALVELIPRILMDRIKVQYKGSELIGDLLNLIWSPSISYGYMISRALATISIETCRLIQEHGGLAIFSGGDDLMAMLPLLNGLRTIMKCRELYSKRVLRVVDDFLRDYERIVVTYEVYGLGSIASQSYSATIFDAFYPLKRIIEYTMANVEGKAKKTLYLTSEKDTMHLAYYPRSGSIVESYIPFRLMGIDGVIDFITKLALGAAVGAGEYGLLASPGCLEIVRGFSGRVLRIKYDLRNDDEWDLFRLEARRAKLDEKILEQLNKYRVYSIKTPDGEYSLANQIIKAGLCILNGLRGSKPLVIGEEL